MATNFIKIPCLLFPPKWACWTNTTSVDKYIAHPDTFINHYLPEQEFQAYLILAKCHMNADLPHGISIDIQTTSSFL